MRDAIKRYVEAAQSITEIPRERAERVARRLAGSGLIDREQIRGVASDLVDRSRENRRKLTDFITREIRRQVTRVGFASKSEVERLRQRVQALEISDRRARQARERPATAPRKASTRTRKSSAGARRKPSRSR
jgi:polyhydroxyalkanoate synthesis regulator phasin